MSQSVSGQFIHADFFKNDEGLNNTDSPFVVKDGQAADGHDYIYDIAGAISTRLGNQKINTVADASLRTTGFGILQSSTSTQNVIRAADRVLQLFTPSTSIFTSLTEDTTLLGTTVFPASNTVPSVSAQFNTDVNTTVTFAGNTSDLYTAYSTTKFTKNGVPVATGSITAGQSSTTGGSGWTSSGTFFYGVSFVKASTGVEGNIALDTSATVSTITAKVTLTFSSITSFDPTTFTSIKLYRSAVGGVSGFTTGDLVATLTTPIVSYEDTGSYSLTAQALPRANSVVLDNSDLPTGTYNVVTTWKRRLVTALGGVLYISDINKPESWPTVNKITIPSGGPITAVSIISFNTQFGNDEYLAVHKDREIWLVRGDDYTDFSLSFIDNIGCPNQALVVPTSGYISWVNANGVYIWDGAGKPIQVSRTIQKYFSSGTDINRTKLLMSHGVYSRNFNVITWYLSHKTYGEQKFSLKMDMRLTLPKVSSNLDGRIMDGVFTPDTLSQATYGAVSILPPATLNERLLVGDASGFVYGAYEALNDSGSAISFNYTTKFLDLGKPNMAKRFHKVIVRVAQSGAYDLTLDYWSSYRASSTQKSTVVAPISTSPAVATSIWDLAVWDLSLWDDYTVSDIGFVTFNLSNEVLGNAEGDSIRLTFRNNTLNQPITIYGYTVVYSEITTRK